MPVRVQWDDALNERGVSRHTDAPHRVLRFVYEGDWNWNEAHMAFDWADVLMKESQQPIAIIIDMTRSYITPHDALQRVKVSAQRTQSNINLIVAVGATPFVSVMAEMVRRLYNRYAIAPYYAATVEDAHAFIAAQQPLPTAAGSE
jgi:hypothetical protein